MVGYLSVFATLGAAIVCTEGGDEYSGSAGCMKIGLPLLAAMDAKLPVTYSTAVPILVAWGPVRNHNNAYVMHT